MFGLRLWVDPLQFELPVILLVFIVMVLATKWGGGLASGIALLALLASDYFFVDPTYSFGVHSWCGVIEMAQFGFGAAVLGILAVRFFRWWQLK
jgi:K+-sensing histidine kinase KdpD